MALTTPGSRTTAETAQETALTEGLVPLHDWVKAFIDGVLATEFAAPDPEFARRTDRAQIPANIEGALGRLFYCPQGKRGTR